MIAKTGLNVHGMLKEIRSLVLSEQAFVNFITKR